MKNSAALQRFKEFNRNYFIFYLLVAEIVILALAVPKGAFLTYDNIMNTLRQCSITAIIAAGAFLVLLAGGIDLSVGSTVALVGVMTAKLIVDLGMNLWAAILCGILMSVAVGLINGLLVTKLNIPPFIVTLGTMEAVRGITYVATNAYPVSNLPKQIQVIGRGYFLGIPIPVLIMAALYLAVYLAAEHTRFGRHIYAIGSNEEAAYLSGIKVKRVRTIVFMVSSILAAVSGIILLSRLSSGQPNGGTGYEFQAITAAVLGGTSTAGGKGRIVGVLFGALFIATMNNGMTMLNVNSYYQQIARGVILIIAVTFDVLQIRRSKK